MEDKEERHIALDNLMMEILTVVGLDYFAKECKEILIKLK